MTLKQMFDALFYFVVFIVLPNVLLVLALAVIVCPAVLRWMIPCKTQVGKIIATALIGLITLAWVASRLKNPSMEFMLLDCLLLLAWLVLGLSLVVWPGRMKRPQ
jgi:hypothetical protein